MPDGIRQCRDSTAEVDSPVSGPDESAVIPLRPAGTPKTRRRPRPRKLSPLWSEIASVLARARPADHIAAATNAEEHPGDRDRQAA